MLENKNKLRKKSLKWKKKKKKVRGNQYPVITRLDRGDVSTGKTSDKI